MRLLGERSMPDSFEPKTEILPKAQQQLLPLLTPAPRLSFVLYGGTAVALHLGHCSSVDLDFFRTGPLDKKDVENVLHFHARCRDAATCRRFRPRRANQMPFREDRDSFDIFEAVAQVQRRSLIVPLGVPRAQMIHFVCRKRD